MKKKRRRKRLPVQLMEFPTMVNLPHTLPKLQCLRCGHRWIPRREGRPGNCPNKHCHSAIWDQPLV